MKNNINNINHNFFLNIYLYIINYTYIYITFLKKLYIFCIHNAVYINSYGILFLLLNNFYLSLFLLEPTVSFPFDISNLYN